MKSRKKHSMPKVHFYKFNKHQTLIKKWPVPKILKVYQKSSEKWERVKKYDAIFFWLVGTYLVCIHEQLGNACRQKT